MIRIFSTINDIFTEVGTPAEAKNPWVNLVSPTQFEIEQTAALTSANLDFLKAALDEEEQPRLDFEDGQGLIIINVPIKRDTIRFDTIPLGIVITDSFLITVCLEQNEVLDALITSRPKALHTGKRSRFVLQLLYTTATQYLKYLRQIERKKDASEAALLKSMKNRELVDLLALSKGLVYFTTSLRSNQAVLGRLLRLHFHKQTDQAEFSPILCMYPEDEDLLEDVITENKQAIEMGDVYSSTLSGMMDAFASVISNNLNMVMKFLTSVTIVLAIPSIVSGFYGMNVRLPGQGSPVAFGGILLVSLVLGIGAAWALAKRRMF